MNEIYKDINNVRRQLKALELRLFVQGADADIDSTVMDDIERAMESLVAIEKKVSSAALIILNTNSEVENE